MISGAPKGVSADGQRRVGPAYCTAIDGVQAEIVDTFKT